MTKYYCDKCNKECDWRDMIRISADREAITRSTIKRSSIEIHERYELCEECYRKIFVTKEGE